MRILLSTAALLPTAALVLLASASRRSDAADPPASAPAHSSRFATDPERLTSPTVVSSRWVSAHSAEVVVLDARPDPRDYATAHIPRAVHAPVDSIRTTRNGVPDE